MIERLCRSCGRTFNQFNTLQSKCGLCQYNKYEKPKKPLKRVGPVTKKWIQTRQEWLRLNPEPWVCYICGKKLDINTITLDHVKARSRQPDLRFNQDNLKACCWACNDSKGSKDLT